MGTSTLLVCFLVSLVLHSEVRSQSPCTEKNKIYVEDSFPASLEDCKEVCTVSESCTFYTWIRNKCGIRTYSPNGLVNGAQDQIVASKAHSFTQLTAGKVYVGKALFIKDGTSLDCQESCQGNDDCQSWTWNAVDSSNSQVCAHNYGKTERRLDLPNKDSKISGPKYCRIEISTKTSSRINSETDDPVSITLCGKSGEYCCSTPLDNPGYDDREIGRIDTFSGPDVLGLCFNFVKGKEDLLVTLKKTGTNGWYVEWVKIKFAEGISFNCAFNLMLDNDPPNSVSKTVQCSTK